MKVQNQPIMAHQNHHSFSLVVNPKMSLDQLMVILVEALVRQTHLFPTMDMTFQHTRIIPNSFILTNPTDSNHTSINPIPIMHIMEVKWVETNMLSNNNLSSIHSIVVSTKCQGSKFHQLLLKMDSVSNKTIILRNKIIMGLNLEKARMVLPETDMK